MITIVTFNVHGWLDKKKFSEELFKKIAYYLKSLNPDIVCLNEVFNNVDQTSRLCKILFNLPNDANTSENVFFGKTFDSSSIGLPRGNSVISKFKFKSKPSVLFLDSQRCETYHKNKKCACTKSPNREKSSKITTHDCREQRGCSCVMLDIHGINLNLFSVHLDCGRIENNRVKELKTLKNCKLFTNSLCKIMIGDLNAMNIRNYSEKNENILRDKFEKIGWDWQWGSREKRKSIECDNLTMDFVSKEMKLFDLFEKCNYEKLKVEDRKVHEKEHMSFCREKKVLKKFGEGKKLFMGYRIDHILGDDEFLKKFEIVSVKIDTSCNLSDHFPVILKCKIKK